MEKNEKYYTQICLNEKNRRLLKQTSNELNISQNAVINTLISKLSQRYDRTQKEG